MKYVYCYCLVTYLYPTSLFKAYGGVGGMWKDVRVVSGMQAVVSSSASKVPYCNLPWQADLNDKEVTCLKFMVYLNWSLKIFALWDVVSCWKSCVQVFGLLLFPCGLPIYILKSVHI
jgi:hypothetical protein